MSTKPAIRVMSFGAGVQSTTLALMAAYGLTEHRPDFAVFADTGSEPAAVRAQLEWIEPLLPFPLLVCSAGNLGDDIQGITGKSRFASIPYFLDRAEQGAGVAMGRRQCTREYKVEPLARMMRQLLGKGPRDRIAPGACEVWIGISTDEAQRMKPARNLWQTHRWPLIEMGLSRQDCLDWMEVYGFPRPPKSACTFCPYRDNAGWQEMKENDPVSFGEACGIDHALRLRQDALRLRAVPYIHRSCQPLEQVDFAALIASRAAAKEARQRARDPMGEECEGMCGV